MPVHLEDTRTYRIGYDRRTLYLVLKMSVMTESQTAFLVLRAPALLPENQGKRDRLLGDIARQLGVENECDLVTITNIAAEGTDTAARFPVSQETLRDGISPSWDSHMAELFLMPGPD